MPTHEEAPRFWRDWDRLTAAQQRAFFAAVGNFVGGLRQQPPKFGPSLRLKRIQGTAGVWEMTWAADGRATFDYGAAQTSGESHIRWRRIGTHNIFREP